MAGFGRIRVLVLMAALVVTAVAAHVSAGSGEIEWFTDTEVAARAAGERGAVMMLEFYADYCTACKKLEQEVFTDSAVVALSSDMVNVKINVGTDEGLKLAGFYGVDATPTVIFVTSKGQEIKRLVGYHSAENSIGQLVELARLRE